MLVCLLAYMRVVCAYVQLFGNVAVVLCVCALVCLFVLMFICSYMDFCVCLFGVLVASVSVFVCLHVGLFDYLIVLLVN